MVWGFYRERDEIMLRFVLRKFIVVFLYGCNGNEIGNDLIKSKVILEK